MTNKRGATNLKVGVFTEFTEATRITGGLINHKPEI